MPTDSTDIERFDIGRNDFISMIYEMIKKINWRIAIYIYIFGVLVFSDFFADTFLSEVEGAMDGGCVSTKGTLIQLTLMSAFYILVDLLVQGSIL